jgi:hypothetical protein
MKTPLIYGAAMAIGGALLTLILFFAGFHDSAEKMGSGIAQSLGMVGGLLIAVVCLVLAMRDKRANTSPDLPWGYGSALGTGVLTGLFSALFGAIFTYIYFAFLNPGVTNIMYEVELAKMEARGTPPEQIDAAEGMMRFMFSPGMATLVQTIVGIVVIVILSLIIAIFYKNRPAALQTEPPPL